MDFFKFNFRTAILTVLVLLGSGLNSVSAAPLALDRCSVPYIETGGSALVDERTVSVIAAEETYLYADDYYLHSPYFAGLNLPGYANGVTPITTWTFSPGISELNLELLANSDSSSIPETYTLLGFDADNNQVGSFTRTNSNESGVLVGSAPMVRVELTYSPADGYYGSAIRLSLTRLGGVCGPDTISADVIPQDMTVAFGDEEPSYNFEIQVGGNATNLESIPGWNAPNCDSNYVKGVTPAGAQLIITCSGASADGYEFDHTATALLNVTEAPTTIHLKIDNSIRRGDPLDQIVKIAPGICESSAIISIRPNPFNRDIESFETLNDEIDTTEWLPGRYFAEAFVPSSANCGESVSNNQIFNILKSPSEVSHLATEILEAGTDFSSSVSVTPSYCLASTEIVITPSPLTGESSGLKIQPGVVSTADWAAGNYQVQAHVPESQNCKSTFSNPTMLEVIKPTTEISERISITIYFDVLSSKISKAAKNKLKLIPMNATNIRITGFVQGWKPGANENSLSKARAKAVRNYLRYIGFTENIKIKTGGIHGRGKDSRKAVINFTQVTANS